MAKIKRNMRFNKINCLTIWMSKNGRNQSWVAAKIGVTRQTVSEWCNFRCSPCVLSDKLLRRMSKGKVSAEILESDKAKHKAA